MKTNAILVACATIALAAASPLMAAVDHVWSVNASDPDNILTNEVHFTSVLADIAHTNAIKLTAASDMTVRMPAGSDWSAPFGLKFFVNSGSILTLDFADATLTQPNTTAEAPYTQDGRFGLGFGTGHMFQYAWPSHSVNGAFRIEDGLLTITNNVGGENGIDFRRGTWDFLAPNSVTNSGAYLYIAASWQSSGKFKMNFHQGSELRSPIFFIYGSTRTNEINVLGGSHYMATLTMRKTSGTNHDTFARTRLNVVGADTRLTIGGFSIDSGTQQGYRVYVGDGATLVSRGNISQKQDVMHDFVFDSGKFGTDGKKVIWDEMSVFATNSEFTTAAMVLSSGRMELKDSAWSTDANMYLGYTSGRPATLRIDGGTFSVAYAVFVGTDKAGAEGAIEIVDGTVGFNEPVYLGNKAGAFGSLSVSGGELTENDSLVLGCEGSSEMTVSGGRVSTPMINYVSNNASTDTTNVLRQTGGEIIIGESISMVAAANSIRACAELVLEGGVLETPVVGGGAGCRAYDASKTGVAVLRGNGGTLRAATASESFVHHLSSATCGANGLTVESDYDITIPQSFADADGVAGELILTGSGTKTLSGTATTVSKIVVAGGTVVFAEGARAASEVVVTNGAHVVFAESPSTIGLTGFVCGDVSSAGGITVASGSPLDFGSAPVALGNVRLCLDGEFASGSTYEMMRTTAAVSAATKAAWADVLGVAGFVDDRSYSFGDSESSGTTSFNMAVSAAARTFTVASGMETVSDDVVVARMEAIAADVASGASLTFEGELSGGGLVKTGEGRLFLEDAGNSFVRGVVSGGGLFSAASVGAIGISENSAFGLKLTGGTFEYRGDGTPATLPGALWISTTNAKSSVGMKIESPLTIGDATVDGGAIIKRGVAPLTFAPQSGTTLTLAPSAGYNQGGDPKAPQGIGDLSDETGALPSSGYLGFNVAEGEVRLVGDSTTTFRFVNAMIGVGATNGRVQPSLVVDGAKADFSISSMHVQMSAYSPSGSFNVAPTFLMTNGAEVIMHTFICGRLGSIVSYPTVTVDRATWTVSSMRAGYNWNCYPRYFLRNRAVVNVGSFLCYGPSYFFVTNSVVRKNAAGDCTTAEIHASGGEWLFGEGSTLAMSTIKTTSGSPCTGFTLAFDGGTWETGGSADLFHLYLAENFTFQTRGAGGLTLPVADGKTLAVGRAISGNGGIVKTGPGTLSFETQGTWNAYLTEKTALADPVSLAFSGLLDVREGSVAVASGACRAGGAYKAAEGASVDFGGNSLGGASFAGAGEFANAAVSGATISVPVEGGVAEAPTFDGVSFDGSVFVDFARPYDAAEALEGVVVARFVGAAPANLSKWRGRNVGKGFKATFTASGNEVVANVDRVGAILIVR